MVLEQMPVEEKAPEVPQVTIEQEKADLLSNAAKLQGSAQKSAEVLGALEEGIDEKDVPQDIKDEITQIQEDQREKLRQTMLQAPMKKKTTALKNLTNMFEQYPVVTNESQKLKMEVISEIKDDGVDVEGMNCKQQLYSRLLTSINPFAQFVIREQIELKDNFARKSKKHWVLDEAIFAKSEYKPKKENLLKTSSEMFSIYIYVKDPMM